ncbi:hypothetical protein [Pedococcus soli]
MDDPLRLAAEQRTRAATGSYFEMLARRKFTSGVVDRGAVKFDEFRQLVRRHRPSVLLPALAALTLSSGEPFDRPKFVEACPPWAVALAARESILWSNEHRGSGELDGDDLRVLFNSHNNLYEGDHPAVSQAVLGLLTRVTYEQFPYGESIFEEVTRSHAMMVDYPTGTPLEVLSDADAWTRMLGMDLGMAVGVTFFLQVAANVNAGWYDPTWLNQSNFSEVLQHWPRAAIEQRMSDLSSTFAEFKQDYARMPKPPAGLERYAYNPLTRRPFILMPDGRYLAPQPRLILRTITPGGLFQVGKDSLGAPFPRDLGELTEAYVGRQLRLLEPEASVFPEVVYGPENVKSIDWFLVLPSVVVMFEVKSARFGILEKAGLLGFEERSRNLITKANDQLQRTSDALDAGNPELARIPTDRPRIGVMVTAEPHYLSNSQFMRQMVSAAGFPTLVASTREVERLVTMPVAEIERQLVAVTADPERSTWSLGSALKDDPAHRNPILEQAWAAYPLLHGLDDVAP